MNGKTKAIEIKEKNFRIFQLRGILQRLKIKTDVPKGFVLLQDEDILKNISSDERIIFNSIIERIFNNINNIKIKRFVCISCAKNENIKIRKKATKDKKAIQCDFCKSWKNDELLLYKIPIPKNKEEKL